MGSEKNSHLHMIRVWTTAKLFYTLFLNTIKNRNLKLLFFSKFSGARDALYRLSLEGLTKLEKAEWPAKQDKISLCITKGQSEKDCRNFVKVLVSHQDQLLACGTYSFSPKCSWRPIEAIRYHSYIT